MEANSKLDSDDYFLEDPDAFDLDDYDECVLGAEAEEGIPPDVELTNACLSGVGCSFRVLVSEGRRAGKKLAKHTGDRVEGGVKVAMEHIPQMGEKSAKAFKTVAKKVVGEENVSKFKQSVDELPEGWLARIFWFWEQPFVKLGRLTVFFARLPAVWALALTQVGLFAGQLSLPMLPPLLLGAGMLLRSIWVNANYIFPRIYIIAILLYITWFGNSLVQKTMVYLKRQGTVDAGFATTIITWTECTAILIAGVIILSMLGVNISGLFLPAGICLAIASREVAHNFVAGIFLFLVQPFKTGDDVSVQSSVPVGAGGGWMKGTCEKVDLRYTVLRQGQQLLFIPNKCFMTKEFLVLDHTASTEESDEDGHMWDPMPGAAIPLHDRSIPSAVHQAENSKRPYPGWSDYPKQDAAAAGLPSPSAQPFIQNHIQRAPPHPLSSASDGSVTANQVPTNGEEPHGNIASIDPRTNGQKQEE